MRNIVEDVEDEKGKYILRATYNATPDNLVAFTGATNIKALNVNGTSITIEPIKNETTTFDVLGENISMNLETSEATFPESYLIKSPVSSWSFKAKDPNYTINENTYICVLRLRDGMTMAQPIPFEEAMGYAFTTNDGVTLEAVDTFLFEMNTQIQSGLQMCFTLCNMDMNSGTFVFIDTEHQTNVITGGLHTYLFDSEGLYNVEIELADPEIRMRFAETSLTSIEISDGITLIGDQAFCYCTSLTSITIPNKVTSIGRLAFDGCESLTSVYINDIAAWCNISFIDILSNPLYYTHNLYLNNKLVTDLNIPDGVTTIGNYTFYNCSNLTSIAIPDSVTSIGESAFYDCSNLASVIIPNKVTTIGNEAFYGCSTLASVTIPDSVTYIGYHAFNTCSRLTSVTIPDSVTKIGLDTFSNCTSLSSVTIGSGVETIGPGVFYFCSSLTSITCYAPTAPSVQDTTFSEISNGGTLYVPIGSDYSSWMSKNSNYLGYYNWTIQYI